MDFSMNQFCFNLSLARCRQLCLLFPNFKWIRTFPAKLSALTVMCVCECISPLSVYLPSHISPLTHTHRYRINTHRAATSGFHLPALHVSNGYVFSSPPLPAQTWICGKADTHTRHTHTQTHANTHSHTEFSIPFAATSTPTSPPPSFPTLFFL